MPAVADLPPKPPVVHVLPVADAFGVEGRFVSTAAEQAAKHWEDRAQWLLMNSSEFDEVDYEPVPLDYAGTVRVQYERAGEIQPMPYDWDE